MRMPESSVDFQEQAVRKTLTGDESIREIAEGLGFSEWFTMRWLGYMRYSQVYASICEQESVSG